MFVILVVVVDAVGENKASTLTLINITLKCSILLKNIHFYPIM